MSARASRRPSEEDDIPVVGRPAGLPFSGASGAFTVEAKAEPTSLRVEAPITYTVTVSATGSFRHAPRRPDLRLLPAFVGGFYIEDLEQAKRPADARTWAFVYRLKPRRADVSEGPALPFVYFNPAIHPASRGFQISYTDAIPLKILAAEEYAPLPALSDATYSLATGPGVLGTRQAADDRTGLPRRLVLLIAGERRRLVCGAFLLPPGKIRHPDASRKTRRRRSRAANEALRLLRSARRSADAAARLADPADALARYLHERFDLAAADPTPAKEAASGSLRPEPGCAAPRRGRGGPRSFAACDDCPLRARRPSGASPGR